MESVIQSFYGFHWEFFDAIRDFISLALASGGSTRLDSDFIFDRYLFQHKERPHALR